MFRWVDGDPEALVGDPWKKGALHRLKDTSLERVNDMLNRRDTSNSQEGGRRRAENRGYINRYIYSQDVPRTGARQVTIYSMTIQILSKFAVMRVYVVQDLCRTDPTRHR